MLSCCLMFSGLSGQAYCYSLCLAHMVLRRLMATAMQTEPVPVFLRSDEVMPLRKTPWDKSFIWEGGTGKQHQA